MQNEIEELKLINMQLNNFNERENTGLKLDELDRSNKN